MPRTRVFFSTLILFVLILLVWRCIALFSISEIRVFGDRADIVINKNVFVGNILFFNTRNVEEKIQEDNPFIRTVSIKKKLPNIIEITVYKRIPAATIESKGHRFAVDVDGVLLGDGQNSPLLPYIITDIPLPGIGGRLQNPFVLFSLRFIEGSKSFLTVQRIYQIETSSLRVETAETNINITQKQDLQSALDTLQILINGFRIKGSMPKTIDLRFGKPVVQ